MNQEHVEDPRGKYNADEVVLRVDSVSIAKGDGATGAFLEIGPDRTHFQTTVGSDGEPASSPVRNPTRPMVIVLLCSSEGNAILRCIRKTGRPAQLRVERRQDGAVLMDAEVLTVDDESTLDVGRGELGWNLTVVG
jgi:hypothetical protein